MKNVAIIGGGIAGCGCSWALQQSGYKVTLFESRHVIGGNAKTQEWTLPQSQNKIVSGLSVLAWPREYFHNYIRLLSEFQIETESVKLPFAIDDKENSILFFQDDKSSNGWEYYKNDIVQWNKMICLVRKINNFLNGSQKYKSLYNIDKLNPFNFIPMRFLAWIFGVSGQFWDKIVVSIYGSSFLSVKMNYYPSIILPILDDLISINKIPQMDTWSNNSTQVFELLTKGIQSNINCEIQSIYKNNQTNQYTILDTNGFQYNNFDAIVFSCNSQTVKKCLLSSNLTSYAKFIGRIIGLINYSDENDDSFKEGIIHSDQNIFPSLIREQLLKNNSNYIRINTSKGINSYENTFILNSWLPSIKREKEEIPMLVTYNPQNQLKIQFQKGKVQNIKAHPHLSFKNLLIGQIIPFFQGKFQLYYCGSYCTPGNGHDLSLLSGFIIANQIGANYPFEDDIAAFGDFKRLKKLMIY